MLIGLLDFYLPTNEKLLVQAFNYKVNTGISGIACSKLRRAFPDRIVDLPTSDKLHSRIGALAGLRGAAIDCCINSCMAYTGDYKDEDTCPYCTEPRYKSHPSVPARRVPRMPFPYIPIIPRLPTLFLDPTMARKLRYRSTQQATPNSITDIFDGKYYNRLLGQQVVGGAETLEHTYFSQPTDLALGLSTDEFGPFESRKQTCWPIILFNYNLPPTIRTQLQHIMCFGVIPGPKTPKDPVSYLEPLINELQDLACGIPAVDAVDGRAFDLRAYLLSCFGDMPAVAKLMAMKGPNGKRPCRACKIDAVRPTRADRTTREDKTLCTPLSRSFLRDRTRHHPYGPLNLPRRTHTDHIQQALSIENTKNDADEKAKSRDTGINSLSPPACLSSLEFPTSFPHDLMHNLFENVLSNLLDLWAQAGLWKTFGTGEEDYLLHPNVWSAIGAACARSGDTIHSAFGCRVLNLKDKRYEITSESMLLFATLLGPALLCGRFTRPRCYTHFVRLVKLINLCMGFEITADEVQELREGFTRWVQDFER